MNRPDQKGDQRPPAIHFANTDEARKFAKSRTAEGGELGGTFIFGTDRITFRPKTTSEIVTNTPSASARIAKADTGREEKKRHWSASDTGRQLDEENRWKDRYNDYDI